MKTLLKYDFFYMKKTSRLIIIGAIILFFAILSPVTAKYMNELLALVLDDSGIQIELGTPTVRDSYIQYIGNLYELILYVFIFMSVGMFIRDKTKGVLPLILSKPIVRWKYLLSKYIVFNLVVLIGLLVGYLVFGYYTYYLFDQVDMLAMLQVMLLYYVYVLFITGLAMLASTLVHSYPLAILITFVGYIFFSILGIATRGLMQYLPGQVINQIGMIIAQNVISKDVWFTVLLTLLITCTLLIGAIFRFQKTTI